MRIDDLNRAPLTQSAEKADAAGQKRALEANSAAARGTDQADVSQLAQALAPRDPKRIEQLKLAGGIREVRCFRGSRSQGYYRLTPSRISATNCPGVRARLTVRRE